MVSAGEANEELVSLLLSLSEGTCAMCAEAIIIYAIENNMSAMLEIVLRNAKKVMVSENSVNRLWVKVCQKNDPDVIDVFIANTSSISSLSYKQLFLAALSLEGTYAVKCLEPFMTQEEIVNGIFTHGESLSSGVISGFDGHLELVCNNTPAWIKGWVSIKYGGAGSSRNRNREEQLRFWLSYQEPSALRSLWDAALTHGRAWIVRVLKEELPLSSVAPATAYGFIENGFFEIFRETRSALVIKNCQELQDALFQLVQMNGQLPFITHLMTEALPATKNFFCRLVGVSYDKLDLKKINYDFMCDAKIDGAHEISIQYFQLIYMGLMKDKFGIETLSRHISSSWQVDCLIALNVTPMDMLRGVQSSEAKSHLLFKLSE